MDDWIVYAIAGWLLIGSVSTQPKLKARFGGVLPKGSDTQGFILWVLIGILFMLGVIADTVRAAFTSFILSRATTWWRSSKHLGSIRLSQCPIPYAVGQWDSGTDIHYIDPFGEVRLDVDNPNSRK